MEKYIRTSPLSDNSIRIRIKNSDDFKETTGPVCYGIFNVDEINTDNIEVIKGNDKITIKNIALNKEIVIKNNHINNEGFLADIEVESNEKFYGLGDVSRDTVEKRGYVADIWVTNVSSYVPIPFLMSSNNYGIYSNTTYRQHFDVCNKDENTVSIWSYKGECDLVFFFGNSYSEVINEYNNFSGKPSLLPLYAYGLTYVCHEAHTDNDVLNDMLNFRREEIPCDVIGLEPGWMEKYYDNSVDKTFNKEKFRIPYWQEIGKAMKRNTFLGSIERLGFKLSLWLCSDYDFSFEEERNAKIPIKEESHKYKDSYLPSPDAFEIDQNIGHDPIYMDKVTKRKEPWFDHLKKFVDGGAKAFKLDGAWQVNEHPDRLYGNDMRDDEMHNLYPLIYNKQMSKGYEDYTNSRSMIYSSGGFAGIQQYSATWAGDTGGGAKPLISMINHAMSGHMNTSCDLTPYEKESIHFGFLQSWSQLNSWAYTRQPWLLDEETKNIFKYYAQLRYKLLPYIYSSAYQGHLFSIPIMRALPFVYPDDNMVDNILTSYMLGDYFLVTCFSDEIYLPQGEWIDYFTKEVYQGPLSMPYTPPKDKGGALFVKSGAIIPMWEQIQFVDKKSPNNITLEIYPSKNSIYTLYEDDGNSLEYKNGTRCETVIECSKDTDILVTIKKVIGTYAAMEKARKVTLNIFADKAQKILLNNSELSYSYKNGFINLDIEKSSNEEIKIKLVY